MCNSWRIRKRRMWYPNLMGVLDDRIKYIEQLNVFASSGGTVVFLTTPSRAPEHHLFLHAPVFFIRPASYNVDSGAALMCGRSRHVTKYFPVTWLLRSCERKRRRADKSKDGANHLSTQDTCDRLTVPCCTELVMMLQVLQNLCLPAMKAALFYF